MDKNIKIIAIASALLVGGYFIYKYLKSKPLIPSEPETPFGSLPTSKNDGLITSSSTPNNASSESSTTQASSTNNTPVESSSSTPSSTNNVESNSNTSYQTYGNTNVVNNPAYQTYVSAVKSGSVSNTYQNYMASVPEGNTSPSQYLTNYIASTQVSTNTSNLPGWIQAELKSGQIASYTDVNTGITYV